MQEKIIRNAIRCKKCGVIVESTSRHDMVWCPCGTCAVDGGHAYLRRAYRTDNPEEAFEELSEFEDTSES